MRRPGADWQKQPAADRTGLPAAGRSALNGSMPMTDIPIPNGRRADRQAGRQAGGQRKTLPAAAGTQANADAHHKTLAGLQYS